MFLDAFVSVLLSTANNVDGCERFPVSKNYACDAYCVLLQGKGEREEEGYCLLEQVRSTKSISFLTYNAFNLVVVFVFEPMKLVYRERCNECFAVDIAEDDTFLGFDFYFRATCFDVFFCLSRFGTRFFSFVERQLLVFLFVPCGSFHMLCPFVLCAGATL